MSQWKHLSIKTFLSKWQNEYLLQLPPLASNPKNDWKDILLTLQSHWNRRYHVPYGPVIWWYLREEALYLVKERIHNSSTWWRVFLKDENVCKGACSQQAKISTCIAWDAKVTDNNQAFWLLHITSHSLGQAENKEIFFPEQRVRIFELGTWGKVSRLIIPRGKGTLCLDH